MSFRTLFLSRLLGLFFLICGLAMIVHKEVFLGVLATFPRAPSATLYTALLITLAGLSMVLVHNAWSKPPVVVIVTVLGWLTLIKGIAYLLMPERCLEGFFQAVVSSGVYPYFVAAFLLVLGAYLTYEGFKSRPA